MKKSLALLISLIMLFTFNTTVFARTTSANTARNNTIKYLDNGEYITITIEEDTNISIFAANVKSGNKTLNYYNSNNEIVWTAKLSGTFSYTGSSSTCTASSITYSVNDSLWRIISATASKSGNTATGNVTAKYYFLGVPIKIAEESFTLTCSADGTLS